MATTHPRLTPERGRQFGLTVGGAFLVLAAVAWWRGHPWTAGIVAAFGGVLGVSALLVPTLLGPVERAWMALAHQISRVTTPIVMALLYFGLITPVGLLRRLLGRNPLVHPQVDGGFWQSRPPGKRRSASMERQF